VAWGLGALAGDRVDHLVTLSVGHPATFRAGGFEQYEKSWYMLLFQFTGVAEEWLSANGWANFRAWSRHPDADAVIAELEAGSLTPGLNYYPRQPASGDLAALGARAAGDPESDDGRLELW